MKLWKIKPDKATKEAAEFAVEVQNACNGTAILNHLVRHLKAMPNLDGDRKNQHPVVIAVLDKMASLAHTQDCNERVIDAHIACGELAKGNEVDWKIYPL